MRTLDEATQLSGISRTEMGLNLHFSSIPNWYMRMGVDCPVCDNPIDWDWDWVTGKPPQITTDQTPSVVKPILIGAVLVSYGHRWLKMNCIKCHTELFAENFD